MAKFASFSPTSLESIHKTIYKLNSITNQYRWIIDAYVADFYTCNHWGKLPGSVQEYFDAIEPSELGWLLAADEHRKHHIPVRCVAPLSLLALHCCMQSLSLKRVAVDLDSAETKSSIASALLLREASLANDINQTQSLSMVIGRLSQLTECGSVVDVGAGLGHLSRLLTFQHGLTVTTIEADDGHAPVATAYDREMRKDVHKAVEKKKLAPSMTVSSGDSVSSSEFLNTLKRQTSQSEQVNSHKSVSNERHSDTYRNGQLLCSRGIDSSSSSVLSQCHDNDSMRETSCSFRPETGGNETKDKYVLLNSDGTHDSIVSPPGENSLPNHVVCRVQPDIASSQFLEILKARREDKGEEDENSNNFILVGLHACGDLTPTLLRVFVSCKTAVGLASVACCYMKMSSSSSDCLNSEAADLDNYPMSQFLRSLPCSQLSYEAREMACHFADAYFTRLKDNSPHLKVHSFRAALQLLITSVNPGFKSGSVKLVSKKQIQGDFLQYVTENLKKAGIDICTISRDLIDYCESLTTFWKRVMAFYTLRLSLGPAVESLILLDRVLFLLENGLHCVIIPVFDSAISPRNFALLATKSQQAVVVKSEV